MVPSFICVDHYWLELKVWEVQRMSPCNTLCKSETNKHSQVAAGWEATENDERF